MLHDPKVYIDPFTFRPERFLSSEGKDLDPEPGETGAFCFGRRYADRLNVLLYGTCADWRFCAMGVGIFRAVTLRRIPSGSKSPARSPF
jgi:hypothetical protein